MIQVTRVRKLSTATFTRKHSKKCTCNLCSVRKFIQLKSKKISNSSK